MTASSAETPRIAGFALKIRPLSVDATAEASTIEASLTEVPLDAPALLVGDLGAQRGDGIFESISVVNGHAQEVSSHLARLAYSARLADLPLPNAQQWSAAIGLAVARLPLSGELALRLMLGRAGGGGAGAGAGAGGGGAAGAAGAGAGAGAGATDAAVTADAASAAPHAWLIATPAPDSTAVRVHGLRAVTLDRGLDSGAASRAPWLLLGAKTLSYAVNMAAVREAQRRGADEAIFVTSDGFVMEGATSSIIVRGQGEFLTPAPATGILQGTTQLSLFEYLERTGRRTVSRSIPSSLLREVDAAWLVSSVRLAVPITAIDGRAIAVDVALTRELNDYLLSPRA